MLRKTQSREKKIDSPLNYLLGDVQRMRMMAPGRRTLFLKGKIARRLGSSTDSAIPISISHRTPKRRRRRTRKTRGFIVAEIWEEMINTTENDKKSTTSPARDWWSPATSHHSAITTVRCHWISSIATWHTIHAWFVSHVFISLPEHHTDIYLMTNRHVI